MTYTCGQACLLIAKICALPFLQVIRCLCMALECFLLFKLFDYLLMVWVSEWCVRVRGFCINLGHFGTGLPILTVATVYYIIIRRCCLGCWLDLGHRARCWEYNEIENRLCP